MTPAERAAQIHGKFGMFRGQHDEVRRHAAALSTPHELQFPEEPVARAADAEPSIELAAPGELSDRLLKALVGKWPPR